MSRKGKREGPHRRERRFPHHLGKKKDIRKKKIEASLGGEANWEGCQIWGGRELQTV